MTSGEVPGGAATRMTLAAEVAALAEVAPRQTEAVEVELEVGDETLAAVGGSVADEVGRRRRFAAVPGVTLMVAAAADDRQDEVERGGGDQRHRDRRRERRGAGVHHLAKRESR